MKILVVGAAKSGTTIISKTIQNSFSNAHFHMEPKDLEFFQQDFSRDEDPRVVKIIFEHWGRDAKLREAIVKNEMPFKFDKAVLIIRDPRDEELSRIMYFIHPWLHNNGYKGNEYKVAAWINFVKKVEDRPADYSLIQILSFLNKNFSVELKIGFNVLRAYRVFCEKMKDRVHILHYEDFISGNHALLEGYLGVNLVPGKDLGSLDRTRRSATFNNWKKIFKQEDCAFFKANIGGLMEQQGYTDWRLEPVDKLPKEDYSGYLERLVSDYAPRKRNRFLEFFYKK